MAHSEKRQRTEMVLVRFRPDERQELAEAAEERGIGVCELIRRAIRRELEAARD